MDDSNSHVLYGIVLRCGVTLTAIFCLGGCGGDDETREFAQPISVNRSETALTNSPATPVPPTGKPGTSLSPDGPAIPLRSACHPWPRPELPARLDGECTTQELEQEFRLNRVATDAKYQGKFLALSGRVQFANRNLGGQPMIRLKGADERFVVNCVLLYETDLEKVKEGDLCHLQGVYNISVLPALTYCSVKTADNDQIHKVAAEGPATAGPSRRPEFTLTAEQLDAEQLNFEKADDFQGMTRKYGGKVVQVTGQVARVSHIAMGEMVYHCGGLFSTQFYVRTGNPWFCVRPGETVTFIGEGYGQYPCFVNCDVIRVSGTPNPIWTAKSLGEKLEADRVGFPQQFNLTQLMVSGEVTQKSLGKHDKITLTLRSTPKTSVVCEMDSSELMASESVQIGDTITITGLNAKEHPTDSIPLINCLFWRGL